MEIFNLSQLYFTTPFQMESEAEEFEVSALSIAQVRNHDSRHSKIFHIYKTSVTNRNNSKGVYTIYLSGEDNRRLVIIMPYAKDYPENEDRENFVIHKNDPTTIVAGPVSWHYRSHLGFPLKNGSAVEISRPTDPHFRDRLLYIDWEAAGRCHQMVLELAQFWEPQKRQLYKDWIEGF